MVGAAARIVGDVDVAEELVQDVLVTALARWPFSGVPDRPGAWLMTATRNRARNRVRDHAREQARLESAAVIAAAVDEAPAREAIDDDRLRLMFTCCHPVLGTDAQTALTLRLVAGLSTRVIARGLLQPEATVAQRIVRAKRALADARVPFAVPGPDAWDERLPAVLRTVYLIFTEGHTAAEGPDLARPDLCAEGIDLGRLLTELLPACAEAHGLLALMELQASRLATRVDDAGELVVLADQDRRRWDRAKIDAGIAALERAEQLGRRGPLTLQAAIAACHARAATWEDTGWEQIVHLYDELLDLDPSPVVALNRAVAVAMVEGPGTGLALVDELVADGALDRFHLLWATRADLLRRAGRPGDAVADYDRALQLTTNPSELRHLADRRSASATEAAT